MHIEQSDLLPRLFEGGLLERGLTVLDLGPASAETVEFFSQYRCKVNFLDLMSELPADPESLDERGARTWVEEQFSWLADRSIDVCLCWDVLHFLPPELLRRAGLAMANLLHRDSKLHVYAAMHAGGAFPSARYGVVTDSSIGARFSDVEVPFPHVQGVIADALITMRIAKGTLRGPRLEVLLEHD